MLSLLSASIQTSAQSIPISKGTPAQYDGFLITRDAFQKTVVDIEQAEKIKQEYSQFSENEDKRQIGEAAWFFGGAILGGVATFFLVGGASRWKN